MNGLASANGTAKATRPRVAFRSDDDDTRRRLILHHHTESLTHALAEPIFWIAAALCIIGELAILRAAFAPPADAGPSAPVPQPPRGTEMLWAVVPAIALALLLAATWRALH